MAMSHVMAPRDAPAGPSSSRGGGRPASGLPPWTQEQPTAEELTLYTTLSAYADALDALPLDLTRSFSDLRELDAVLGPHLTSLTERLQQLTAIVDDADSYSAGERLLALKEVAEEARAYKMGGEDKIRVALNTAETIISHTTYIDTLLANLNSVPSLAKYLSPPTDTHLAGHLSDGTALAPGSGPGGNNPAIVETYVDTSSPAKKKRPVPATGSGGVIGNAGSSHADKRNDGTGVGNSSSSGVSSKKRKPAGQSAAIRARNQPAADDTDTDTVLARRPAVKRAKANGAASAATATASAAAAAIVGVSADRDDDGRDGGEGTGGVSSSRARSSRARVNVRGSGSDMEEDISDSGSAAPRPARVARAPRPAHPSDSDAASTAPAMGGDDADERRYCFCNNVSYGDMIGCDGNDCEREWFHLGCVGLLKPPQGTWYCDDCAQKRASRNKKSKTKLAKTSGAHGGGVLETKARSASSKR